MSPLASRSLTIAAGVILAFDGAALLGLGLWSGRAVLVLVGLVLFLSAGLVLLSWRWYRRRMDDIAAARRVLGEEAGEILRATRDKSVSGKTKT
ncbi:MAG: hypothetical protein ACJ8BF_12405 [Gemmatimonadales bacterium]